MSEHHENCDVNDINPDGITKPCNCKGRSELAPVAGSVSCFDCHMPYVLFDLDVIVRDDQWQKICPKPYEGAGSGGILCPDCIVRRGKKLPGVTVAKLHFE